MTTLFCLDFDETLSNTDRLRAELEAAIDTIGGKDLLLAYKNAYEQVRKEQGTVRMPLVIRDTAAQFGIGSDIHLQLANLLHTLPYQEYIYPGVTELIARLKERGQVVVFSDGDAFYQAEKIQSSPVADLVDAVVILPNKVDYFAELEGYWPADRYVFVDDKQRVLDAAKLFFGDKAITVLVKQGRYAENGEPSADIVVSNIGEVAERFLALN